MTNKYKVDIPAGTIGSATVAKINTADYPIDTIRYALDGRGCVPGEYTTLRINGRLVMSDTTAEVRDHLSAIWKAHGRCLINGLGLGVVVKAMLAKPEVEHIDVVENNADVIALVGPNYSDPRVTIHHADAYDIQWEAGLRWNVAWHDIWYDICEDNLPEMARLHRKYGRRCDWQDSWCKGRLLAIRRRTANAPWRYA